MLDRSPLADRFVSGTVYQSFLSALTYHRWHAPVSGRVVNILHVTGTYFSSNFYQGFQGHEDGSHQPDGLGATLSQPYLSAVAARGIIFIQAENPNIGLMAAVYIGMGEVLSCEFTVAKGQRLRKGQEIGTFHFSGSSHYLIFRPGTDLVLVEQRMPNVNRAVNSALAIAVDAGADEIDYVLVQCR